MPQFGDEHLSLLAQRAGDERDVGSLGDVLRHRHTGSDGLVVGMCVDEEQAAVGVRRPTERKTWSRLYDCWLDGGMTHPAGDSFPRQNARTQRFSLGRPRSFSVSEDGPHRAVRPIRFGLGPDGTAVAVDGRRRRGRAGGPRPPAGR